MAYEFVFYPDPPTALVTVKPDAGGAYSSVPYTYTDGRQGQVSYVPDGTPNKQGAAVELVAPDYETEILRGFLMLDADQGTARIQVDDKKMKHIGAPPTTTPPAVGSSPLDIINHVYATTQPQLWTLDGCGKFTEDCCDALHAQHSAYWGHVKKDPGQNQYNGHAVDAVHLALNVPGCNAGIYDIIYSSVSAEAKPVFNLAGPPEYELWYYPAADADASKSAPTPVFVLRVR